MKLLEQIKTMHMTFRVDRSPLVNTTGPLIGDIETKMHNGKTLTDADVVAMVKAHLNNLNQLADASGVDVGAERLVLESLLPVQLDAEQIRNVVKEHGLSNIGAAQKHFRENYPGQFDGALVTQIMKELT